MKTAIRWVAAVWIVWMAAPCGAQRPAWAGRITQYMETLRRADGGYAWPDQQQSHLTPTWTAVGTYHALGLKPPQVETLARFIRDHHPQRLKRPEWPLHEFDWQQIEALQWLGEDVKDFAERARAWVRPVDYLARYETHGYPAFQQEVAELLCRKATGLDATLKSYADYVDARRRANGSFNNSIAADDPADGHVINTLWGLRALRARGAEMTRAKETIAWLRACQQRSGHFVHEPRPAIGACDDVVFTWAAVGALKMLNARPADVEACVAYLQSLHNADGGFGDRPGWPSNSLATYYALEALAMVTTLDRPLHQPPGLPEYKPLSGDLKVFTIQIQAPGTGSPADAVELARALKIHLWGAKNSPAGWIARAQQIADARRVPVRFFVANEEYGTFMTVPGQGTYSHISDVIAPAGADFGPSLANSKPAPDWFAFKERRIAPLEKAGGRMIWQFGENEPACRMLLDESVERGGYAAISTFHFGNPDFINSEPFLWHYQHRLPLVALQDNHAKEPWFWSDQLEGFRTLFLAREPTWEGWLEALRNNHVVAVRHDVDSQQKTWIHGGAPGVRQYILAKADEWRWWSEDGKPLAIQRPDVVATILRPDDPFEEGRPEKGAMLRLRRRWQNTTQGLPKTAAVEIVALQVDGKTVPIRKVERKNPAKGPALADEYFIAEVNSGTRSATVTVRPKEGPARDVVIKLD